MKGVPADRRPKMMADQPVARPASLFGSRDLTTKVIMTSLQYDNDPETPKRVEGARVLIQGHERVIVKQNNKH